MKRAIPIGMVGLIVIFVAAANFMGPDAKTPESTVTAFTENLFKSAPPEFDRTAIKNTVDQLSTSAKKNITSLGALANFAGVHDIPDLGYRIVAIYKKDNRAAVKARWDYSGGPVIKLFYLVRENGKWKIESIKNSGN